MSVNGHGDDRNISNDRSANDDYTSKSGNGTKEDKSDKNKFRE